MLGLLFGIFIKRLIGTSLSSIGISARVGVGVVHALSSIEIAPGKVKLGRRSRRALTNRRRSSALGWARSIKNSALRLSLAIVIVGLVASRDRAAVGEAGTTRVASNWARTTMGTTVGTASSAGRNGTVAASRCRAG
jgi:hypothetical protein